MRWLGAKYRGHSGWSQRLNAAVVSKESRVKVPSAWLVDGDEYQLSTLVGSL